MKNNKLKTVLIPLIPVAFIIFLFLFVLTQNSGSFQEKIESGELSYSCNCGWISWDHAIPDGVESLIKEVVNDTSLVIGKKEFTYTQHMKINFIGKSKIVAAVGRKYNFERGLSKQKREEIAFTIFKQTSESFEEMQGAFPFNLNYSAQSSSFKDGDLNGDKIAFYRALRGYTKEKIINLCNPVSKDKSIEMMKQGRYNIKRHWLPEQQSAYPNELNEIKSKSSYMQDDLVFIIEKRKFYIEF